MEEYEYEKEQELFRQLKIASNCECTEDELAYYSGAWRFECDDGRQGIEINYCPFCGVKLLSEE